ncbi:L-seryl-tRNA(Sec) selenium transferase [subsurface metagenome]
MMAAPLDEIEQRAKLWAQALGGLAQVTPGETMVGGGSLPGGTLPTRLVAIGGEGKKGRDMARNTSRRLRSQEIPVIGRISDDVLLLDPRSVLPEEDEMVVKSLRNLVSGPKS